MAAVSGTQRRPDSRGRAFRGPGKLRTVFQSRQMRGRSEQRGQHVQRLGDGEVRGAEQKGSRSQVREEPTL